MNPVESALYKSTLFECKMGFAFAHSNSEKVKMEKVEKQLSENLA